MKEYAFATGFKGNSVPMSEEDASDFLKCILIEECNAEIEVDSINSLPSSIIIQNRIKDLNLPVDFSPAAYLAMLCLTRIPGGLVVILIDALNKFEGQIVNVEMLSELYPYGFYDKKSFTNLIDNYLKPRKLKWSEIY